MGIENSERRDKKDVIDIGFWGISRNTRGAVGACDCRQGHSFQEALSDEYLQYIVQVVKNAKAMSAEFMRRGYDIISGGTDNHLMLIDLRKKKLTGKQAEDALIKADITINKNMVPFDTQSPFVTSGMRIGTPAITTRGMKEKDVIKVVDLIDEALKKPEDVKHLAAVKRKVNSFVRKFPLYN